MLSLKSAYQRITLNRISLAFFLFSFVLCLVQGLIQSLLYSVDADSHALVKDITQMAGLPRQEIASLSGNSKEFKLQLCTGMPFGATAKTCVTMFDSRQSNTPISVPTGYRRSVGEDLSTRQLSSSEQEAMAPSFNSSGNINGLTMPMPNGTTVFLDMQCTRLFLYPQQQFREFVREDAVLVAVQFWLLGISFFAIIYESVPHLLSVLVARAIMTFWSGFSTWRSGEIENYIQRLITADSSPCNVNIFPGYFQTRTTYEIVNLVLNSVSLLLSVFFSFKLLKLYNRQTFKSIGPPKGILQIYRFFLAFLVCLQLSVFWLVAAMSLWIDELMNGAIAVVSSNTAIYLALFIISTLILLPWTIMGWFAVRREMKTLMAGFLFIGVFLIVSWALMFCSADFRLTFMTQAFFASLMTESFVVMIASCVLGVICLKNFDKGLAHYLYVENVLSKDNFQPEVFSNDVEKVSFDSTGNQAEQFSIEDLKENGHRAL